MGVLRGFGYAIAIIILIVGIFFLPFIGIPIIIVAIIMMWALHKGGQVTAMKKDIRALRQLQEENANREFEKQRIDALRKKSELDNSTAQL